MFRELLAAWRRADPLKEMYQSLISMIEECDWMFKAVWQTVLDGNVSPEVKEEVYRRDVNVNRTERSIRRKLVEHLAVQPGQDVPACLILMSVVKDAERLGDYCKNMLEVAGFSAGPLAESPYYERLRETADEVFHMFAHTRKALAESDEALGHEVIVEERALAAGCDALIGRIASDDIPSRKGVPWALLARYLKRVSAHLGNVASSLVMPLHKLDYYDEKWLGKKEEED